MPLSWQEWLHPSFGQRGRIVSPTKPYLWYHYHMNLGDRNGRLVIVSNPWKDGAYYWVKALCDCGTIKTIRKSHFLFTKSCGCIHPRHGGFGTRLYNIWGQIIQRCENHHLRCYPNYGGRGIAVCTEWRDSFSVFRDWALSHGYNDDLLIERRDNDGPYSPQNCTWATMTEQARNKRNSRIVRAFGRAQCLSAWVDDRRCVVKRTTLRNRLNRGWDAEVAITTPCGH